MKVKYEELIVLKKSDLDKIIIDLENLKPNNGDTRLLRVSVLSNLQQLTTKPLIPFIDDAWDGGFNQGYDAGSDAGDLNGTPYIDYINKEIEF
jgi:hypothetical protein